MPVDKVRITPAKCELSYEHIAKTAQAWKALGQRVVMTIGSWDMLHIGHSRYLIKAHEQGDRLIVGVDSDVAIKKYKGPHRPITPQQERMEMVSYLWCVDIVTLITDVDEKGKWQYGLLELVRPDIFVAVQDSYPEDQCRDIRKYVGNLIVLPRQAEDTSSTDIVQRIIKIQMAEEIAAQRKDVKRGSVRTSVARRSPRRIANKKEKKVS